MIDNRTIDSYQFFVIVFLFIIGNTIINAPPLIIIHAKQDAWISSIFALLFGLCLILLYGKLANSYPNKSIIEYSELILGKVIGKTVSMLLIGYFFIIASLMVKQLGDFLTTHLIPETPAFAINILYISLIVYGSYLGLETIARSSEIVFPILLLMLVFLFVFLVSEINLENIKPVLEKGWNPTYKGTVASIGIPYLQLVVFLMFVPFLKQTNKIHKPFLIGTTLAGLFLVLSVLFSILVAGVLMSEYKQYPTYFLAKKINIADIVDRVEPVLAFMWLVTIFFKTTILFYATNLGLKQIFNLGEMKPLLFPMGLLLLILTQFVTPNIVYFNTFFNEIMPAYTLTFGLIIPILLLLIHLLRSKTATNQDV